MTKAQEQELVSEGVMPPDDFHHAVERINEVADEALEIPSNLSDRLRNETRDLLIDAPVLDAITAAISVGHIVLQGPPGTGKSSLARAICRACHASFLPVTAHEDWSVFEVIGRRELEVDENENERIVSVNGYFTEAVVRCAGSIVKHADDPSEPQATWLLIDELNRAHIDRAFGELFSVLGTGDPVPITLPHHPIGNRELVTPRRFRIIATINSVDRQFVNSLSQGIRRRFTFITLDIPPKRRDGETWEHVDVNSSLAVQEFRTIVEQAASRVAKRITSHNREELESFLAGPALSEVTNLLDFAEQIRYAGQSDSIPHLPLGTAQLIDTTELFLMKVKLQGLTEPPFGAAMDWAASVKIAPLFEADIINPSDLEAFADSLGLPFNDHLRRELRKIAAAGLYYVE